MHKEQQQQKNKASFIFKYCDLIRVLGQGSFGKVYLIRHRYTGQQYALKRYNKSTLQRKGKYYMLIRSLLILESLEHPLIIKLINYIITPDQTAIYILFQACKKGNLQELKAQLILRSDSKIIKFVLYQLTEALVYLKSNSIVHRDLKPSNITFNNEAQLKLIDFDQAVCFNKQVFNSAQSTVLKDFGIDIREVLKLFDSQKNRASTFVGTMLYVSPEMMQSTVCDQKSDLWAFGCIFYELFVGKYLCIEFDRQEMFQQQLSNRIQTLSKYTDTLALDLFKRIACYNPQQRITIEEVLEHQFFDEIKSQEVMNECRRQLKRILKANLGIVSPKSLDICQYELQGMRIGKQIFQSLNTAILFQNNTKFDFMMIVSGPRYFKLKHCKKEEKIYICYNEISNITFQDNMIAITLITSQNQIKTIKKYRFKHLYKEMQQNLFKLITKIYNY